MVAMRDDGRAYRPSYYHHDQLLSTPSRRQTISPCARGRRAISSITEIRSPQNALPHRPLVTADDAISKCDIALLSRHEVARFSRTSAFHLLPSTHAGSYARQPTRLCIEYRPRYRPHRKHFLVAPWAQADCCDCHYTLLFAGFRQGPEHSPPQKFWLRPPRRPGAAS